MREQRLQRIDECLSEEWLDQWVSAVVSDVEEYLRKHAAFEAFLGDED
ncbi:MAG: hypothetical protein M3327_09595 [Actinomycetota bacterium]|nr:hypothetical protein [Actinomycetota bacterium]